MGLFDLFLDALIALLAVGFFGLMIRDIATLRRLITTPVGSINEAAVGEQIAVSGTASPARSDTIDGDDSESGVSTLSAPITGRECLLASWEIKEFYGLEWRNGRWVTVDKDVEAIPFEVQEGGSSLRVEPDETIAKDTFSLDLKDRHETVLSHRGDEQPPERVAQLLDERDVREPNVSSTLSGNSEWVQGDRRYYEPLVEPGDDIFLLGTVEKTHNSSLCLRLTADIDSLLTNQGRSAMIKKHVRFAIFSFIGSVGLFAYLNSKYSLWPSALAW